jgi:hypothetical protein
MATTVGHDYAGIIPLRDTHFFSSVPFRNTMLETNYPSTLVQLLPGLDQHSYVLYYSWAVFQVPCSTPVTYDL